MWKIKRKRFWILLAAEAVCLLLLLPGCFRKERRIFCFYGEDISQMAVPSGERLEFQSERFALQPGVYQVRIQSDLAEGQNLSAEIRSDGGYFNSLRSNAVNVFEGDDEMHFDVFVLDKVPSAYVYCGFQGVGTQGLKELDVVLTNRGSRVALFVAAMLFAVLDFLAEFRRRILAGRVTRRQQVVFWTLSAGVLAAYFPYLTDYFVSGADTLFHVSRIAWLKETLAQGMRLPIRIQSRWNYDHGYAVSLFYGDLFLFVPAALMLIGFSVMAAYKMFLFIILAATALIAYRSFYLCVKDEYAALFGSMVYLLIPYHVFNFYNRGALGECLAMTFLPLVAAGMYLLYTEDVSKASYRRCKWYIVAGVSGIIQSHVISTEMTAIFMALTCIVFWRRTFRKQTFCQLFYAAAGTVLVNLWFLLPLLYMMGADEYHLQTIVGEPMGERGLLFAGFFQLLPNKGSAQTGMWQCEPVQLGAGVLLLLAVCVIWRNHRPNRACAVLAAFTVLSLVLSTRYLPWDAIVKIPGIGSMISSLQFPSRFMMPGTCFAGMFAAFFCKTVLDEGGRTVRVLTAVAALLVAGTAVYHVNSIAFESAPVYLYTAENIGTRSVGNGEYLLAELGAVWQSPAFYEGFPIFRWAEAISFVSLIALLAVYLYEKKGLGLRKGGRDERTVL